jgi:isoamylase
VLRGTYAGLAAPAMIEHFRRLGVTASTCCRYTTFSTSNIWQNEGPVNYWGYNSLAFFAPEPRYAARIGGQSVIAEFKTMVRSLHAAGLEVILDVVFNHTAETDEAGPTLSFRGIDNRATTACRPAISPLREFQRLRQHPQSRPSARSANGHGCAALLG